MNYPNIEIKSNKEMLPDRQEWSDFVFNHPNGNIFQTPEIYDVYYHTKHYEPIALFAFEKKIMVGVLLGVIQKEYGSFLGYISSRCIVFGGPLVLNNQPKIIDSLLRNFNKNIKNKVIYSQFRNLFKLKPHTDTFKKNGFYYTPHLNIHIDLNQDLESYWKSLKSKLRQNIRKAEKNEIKFDYINTQEELFTGYQILSKVYKQANLPIPDYTLFLNAFNLLKNKNYAAFFKAHKNGKIIGVRFVLLYKNLVYDWYAGGKKEFYKYNPNDFLPYKVIEWGIKSPDFDTFDFGGAGKPNIPYGVRDHKLKFSKNLFEPGRFEKIHNPVLYNMAKSGFKIWKKVK